MNFYLAGALLLRLLLTLYGRTIYIVAALLADHVLRANLKEKTGEEYPNYVVALITEKKVKTPKYVSDCKKSSDFLEKVQAYMIAALPFVIVRISMFTLLQMRMKLKHFGSLTNGTILCRH